MAACASKQKEPVGQPGTLAEHRVPKPGRGNDKLGNALPAAIPIRLRPNRRASPGCKRCTVRQANATTLRPRTAIEGEEDTVRARVRNACNQGWGLRA